MLVTGSHLQCILITYINMTVHCYPSLYTRFLRINRAFISLFFVMNCNIAKVTLGIYYFVSYAIGIQIHAKKSFILRYIIIDVTFVEDYI